MTVVIPPTSSSATIQPRPSKDTGDILERLRSVESGKCDQREIDRHYWSVRQTLWALGGIFLALLAIIGTVTELRIDAKLKDLYKERYDKQLETLSSLSTKKEMQKSRK